MAESPRWQGPQRRIGLTGGIATGKSTVGQLLQEDHGLPVLDADLFALILLTVQMVQLPRPVQQVFLLDQVVLLLEYRWHCVLYRIVLTRLDLLVR